MNFVFDGPAGICHWTQHAKTQMRYPRGEKAIFREDDFSGLGLSRGRCDSLRVVMRKARSPFYTMLVALYFFFAFLMHSLAQSRVPLPKVVLEATNEIHSNGSSYDELFVRLANDGKVEWDARVGDQKDVRQTTTITSEEVTSIQQALDATDKRRLHEKMGPYYGNTDISGELRLRIGSPNGVFQFSVFNPWGERKIKPLPKEVKSIVCEASTLRSKIAKEPLDKMCESGRPAH
jgi:hypothetical protein